MRDPVELYLENVLCHADLSPGDERGVREELAEHLHLMRAEAHSDDPKEIYTMFSERFGSEKKLGRAIAAAKGRVRTYFKKRMRRWPIQIGVCLVLAFAIRFAVAETFYVPGDSVAPSVPRGSRVLVNKLAGSFSPGDVIVFRHGDGQHWIGIVDRETSDGGYVVEKTIAGKRETIELPKEKIVGRVILNTR